MSAGPLPLSTRERELLRPEVAVLAASIGDPALRQSYGALLEEVENGEVTEEGLSRLEGVLEMGLQTGRFRQRYGAIDAQVLYRLLGRTPRGQALAEALDGVNKALAELEGQTIDGLTISAKGPGSYDLTVETNACRLVIGLGAGGVYLASVEMGV